MRSLPNTGPFPPADVRAAESDIDANRRGRLSRAQADLIKKQQRVNLLMFYLCVSFVGIQIGGAMLVCAPGRGSILAGLLQGVAGVAVLVGTVLGSLLLWKRRNGLAHENVTALDGAVAWTTGERRWVPLAPNPVPLPWTTGQRTWLPVGPNGVPLPIAAGGPVLPPGRWRFYMHDDRVVGAESPLSPSAIWSICQTYPPPTPFPVGDPELLRRVLGQTVGFTPDDLHHHRRGSLSPRQGSGAVVSVEGVLTTGWRMVSKSDVRSLWELGGRSFEVPRAWTVAAPDGVLYRVYLDARSQRILSLEPLPAPYSD